MALRELHGVLAHVADGGTLEGTVKPRLIELTCHKVLRKADDPRAAGWLTRARDALRTQATTIHDAELRRRFLQDIPHHREIVELSEATTGPER